MHFDTLGQTIAGLTGGIASGKSTVSTMLADAGARVVDADRLAHEVVRKEGPAWQDIVRHFGNVVLNTDREIDRRALGEIVFRDMQAKQALESIVHPRVYHAMQRAIRSLSIDHPGDLIILDVPLLIESGWHESLSTVILVYVPERIQQVRLMRRDGLNAADAAARIGAQMPMDAKREHADFIIDNTGSREATHRQVLAVYHTLRHTADHPAADDPPSP
ncbi:MAG: dephospho-CoA kinase [Desulfobacterales bacterium]|jgi:dephospho-CoA kinase